MDRLNGFLRDARAHYPDAVLEDLRGDDDLLEAAVDVELRPVMDSTLGRMRRAAQAEALRIEAVQARLVQAGQLGAPSELQLCLRDDFDALARLVELIESDSRIRQLIRDKNGK